MDGVLFIDKPVGPSSARISTWVKKRLGVRKCGHVGTLDPLASGLLPVVVGKGTRLAFVFNECEKTYDFTVCFGTLTSTDDAQGTVLMRHEHLPTDEQVQQVLPFFVGELDQRPPAFSALKIQGKPAYKTARAGGSVVLPLRKIHVTSLEFLNRVSAEKVRLRVRGQSGLYVRSLGRDMAQALGTCGHVSAIRRIRVGQWDVSSPYVLDWATQISYSKTNLEGLIQGPKVMLDDIPALDVDDPDMEKAILCGQPIACDRAAGTYWVRRKSSQDFLSMARVYEGKLYPWATIA